MLYRCIDCGKEGNGHPGAQRCRSCASKKIWADGKGCKFTSDTRAKMSEAGKRRGYIEASRSPEARAKQSETMKRITSNSAYRAKMSSNRRKDSADPKWRLDVSNRIRAAHSRGVYDNCHDFGRFGPSSLEIKLAHAMDVIGIVYVQQYRPAGYTRFYDFYIPNQGLLIEVDGEHWHSSVEAKTIDREKDLMAVRLGYDILRVGESDLTKLGPDEVVRRWVM